MEKREKNSFKTPLILDEQPSGKRFKLHYEFTYLWKRKGLEIHVDKGFETDLASVPVYIALAVAAGCLVISKYLTAVEWLFWVGLIIVILAVLIQKLGRRNKAAVIHDAIYQGKFKVANSSLITIFTRAEADQIFLDGMADLGVDLWKRYPMYWGVRTGGWLAWRK